MSNALDDGALDHGALDQRPLRQRPLDRKNVWCGAPQAHVMFGPRQRRRRVKKVARGKGEPAAPGSPKIKIAGPEGRQKLTARVCRPSGAGSLFSMIQGLRASRLPLATFLRAFGAHRLMRSL